MAAKASKEEREAAEALEKALEKEGVDLLAENAVETAANPETPETPPEGKPPVDAPDSTPPKAKRGRPSNAEMALRESVGAAGGKSEGATGGAKRGPKPKGKTSDAGTLAKSLVGIHALASMVTGIPEAQLSEAEGEALAAGVIAVCDEYGFSIDGKTGAAMQLFGACAMIYGPRVFMFKARQAKEAYDREQQAKQHGQQQGGFYGAVNPSGN